MKVLVLNGSPRGRRSNSLRLTDAFVDGLSRAVPALERRQVEVASLDLRPCLGCFACWRATPGQCCMDDDMAGVLESLLWADLTVWSFPLYYFGLPGPLKTLLDRQLPLMLPFMESDALSGGHRSRFEGLSSRQVLVSTCGFYTAQGNYDAVTAQFDRLWGPGAYTTLFCGQGELFSVPQLASRTDAYLELVRQAGCQFGAGGVTDATRAQLAEPLFPRQVYERMADASWGQSPKGQEVSEALAFTRQMASLYNPASYPGQDRVIEMDYNDLGERYQLVLGEWDCQVTEPRQAATMTVHTPFDLWQNIGAGQVSGADALMEGRYRVDGDVSLLMDWKKIFGPEEGPVKGAQAGPSMLLLLLPWLAFWTLVPLSSRWGALATTALCCGLPLAFGSRQITVYDRLSSALVGVGALALLAGAPKLTLVPLSYLAFGLLWFLSVFRPVPLTAWYSMAGYGGLTALDNRIFLRTNRVLTGVWGALYLVTPLWTWALLRSGVGGWVGLINSILPALLGLFTRWFQRWYPQHLMTRSSKG